MYSPVIPCCDEPIQSIDAKMRLRLITAKARNMYPKVSRPFLTLYHDHKEVESQERLKEDSAAGRQAVGSKYFILFDFGAI
jgi:hypothetical protein